MPCLKYEPIAYGRSARKSKKVYHGNPGPHRSAQDINGEAEERPMADDPSQPILKDWQTVQSSAAAVSSTLTATVIAANTLNLPGVAISAQQLNVVINIFQQAPSPQALLPQDQSVLEAHVSDLEGQLAKSGREPAVFTCKHYRDKCLKTATSMPQKIDCWLTYAACLAAAVNPRNI